MPRTPTTAAFWVDKVNEIAAESPTAGAKSIHGQLEEIARQEGRADCPGQRTVGRLLQKFRGLPPDALDRYRRFRWPESMEAGLLPWEASRVALDLLKHCRESGMPRPTVAAVRWHWRVSLAIPDSDFKRRNSIALDILSRLSRGESLGTTKLDWELAFEPWRSDEHRDAYERAFPEPTPAGDMLEHQERGKKVTKARKRRKEKGS